MKCVSTVMYSIIINGEPVGLIKPTRGIRQGDPLSPYLFILCVEVLSYHFQMAAQNGTLKGVPTSPNGAKLNHLFFADDSLLFCRATIQEWNRLSGILEMYERASSQRLNKEKTAIYFSRNTSEEARRLILNISGIPAS
jgi:hypothetical protein